MDIEIVEKVKEPGFYRPFTALVGLSAAALFLTDYFVIGILLIATALTSWGVRQAGIKRVGIELATFSTVIIGFTYGAATGAGIGLLLIMLQIVAGQYTQGYIIWVIPSYAVAGFLAGTFSSVGIFTLGASLLIGMQIIFATFSAILPMGNISKYLPYGITNIVFNLFMFKFIAPAVVAVI